MAPTTWRIPARISVSGPQGWAPVERVVVHHVDGDARVTVESWPVAADADLQELAATHADRGRHAGDPVDEPWVAATVVGRPNGLRRTVHGRDNRGRERMVVQSYVLVGQRMYAVGQEVPAEDGARKTEAAQIAASVSLSPAFAIDPALLPLRSESAADLGRVGSAWLDGRPVDDLPELVLTTEECFAVARRHGVLMLPGADVRDWNGLDEAQRDLVCGAAWRSLAARGFATNPALRETMEIAASHDLLLVVTWGAAPTTRAAWFAAREDRAVRITPDPTPGVMRLTTFDTEQLADVVIVTTEAEGASASCVYRQDGRVVGHETTWSGDADARSPLVALLPETGRLRVGVTQCHLSAP